MHLPDGRWACDSYRHEWSKIVIYKRAKIAVTCLGRDSGGATHPKPSRVYHALRQLSKEVSDCYAHAVDCAGKAAKAITGESREGYLRLEQNWLALACSYEFGERLNDFSKENKRLRAEFFGNDTLHD